LGLRGGHIEGRFILHEEELHGLYCSQNIIWVIKSSWTRWAGMDDDSNEYKALARKPKERNDLEDLSLNWILKWIFKIGWDEVFDSGYGKVAGSRSFGLCEMPE
jgi:hypothetical protein